MSSCSRAPTGSDPGSLRSGPNNGSPGGEPAAPSPAPSDPSSNPLALANQPIGSQTKNLAMPLGALTQAVDSPQSGAAPTSTTSPLPLAEAATVDDDHMHWELIGLGVAGGIFTTGLAVEAWRRYVNGIRPSPEHHGVHSPEGDGARTGAPSSGSQPGSSSAGEGVASTATPGDPSSNYATAESNLAQALDQLFREAETIAASAAPDTEPSFEHGRIRATDSGTSADTLMVPRSALTGLLTRIAAAQNAATEAVLACAHCAMPNALSRRTPSSSTAEDAPRLAGRLSAGEASLDDFFAPTASADRAAPDISADPAQEVIREMLVLLQENGDPDTLSWRQKAWAWMRASGVNTFDLLYRRAPSAFLNFMEDPRSGTRRGIGWSANLIGESGAIPGSLIVTGIVPWFIFFESTMDPFHAWCTLAIPIYLGAANNVLQTSSSLRTGNAFRGEELSLGERLAQTRGLLRLRREVERKRNAIVLRVVAAGMAHGFKKNPYLKRQNERLELAPSWVRHLAQSRLWGDFVEAEARERLAAQAVSASTGAPQNRFFVAAFNQPDRVSQSLFAATLDDVFRLDAQSADNSEQVRRRTSTERALRWSGLIAELEEIIHWLSVRADLLSETQQLTNASYYSLKWNLGRITARLRRLELLGYLQINEIHMHVANSTGLAGAAFAPYQSILDRTLQLLQTVHGQMSSAKTAAEATNVPQELDLKHLGSTVQAMSEQIQGEIEMSRDSSRIPRAHGDFGTLPDQRRPRPRVEQDQWWQECQARAL